MKISVIIPARNEEKQLGPLINHIRSTSQQCSTEIVVVDGKSKDNTLALAQNKADIAIKGSDACRGTQMHEGADASSGHILVFLHADTRLPEHWQSALIKAWSHPRKPVATAFKLSFDHHRFYYKFMSSLANFRTRWLTRVPHGDQAIAVDRHSYFQCGGFPDVPIMEEYYLFRRLRRMGRTRILPEKVKTSARRYEKNGPVKNNFRNLSLIFLFYIGVPPHRLAKLYQ